MTLKLTAVQRAGYAGNCTIEVVRLNDIRSQMCIHREFSSRRKYLGTVEYSTMAARVAVKRPSRVWVRIEVNLHWLGLEVLEN